MTKTLTASRNHFVAIFVMSFVALAAQVLLTRFLSVVFYYHMAFAAVTLAMLGLTGGAIKILVDRKAFPPEQTNSLLASYGWRFALSYILGVLLIIDVNALKFGGPLTIGGAIFLLIYAFHCVGVYIALILTHFSKQSPVLYAADLVGAALGCVAIIGLLFFIDPIAAMLLLAAAVVGVSIKLLPANTPRTTQWNYRALAVLCALLCVTQATLNMTGQGGMRLSWAKGGELARPLFEKWNTYSRVDVSTYGDKEPFGWGYARPQTGIKIDQHFLRIDAQAGTVLTRFDGDFSKIRYLKEDIINSGYLFRPIDKVAIIGVGGGRDVLSALTFGAKHITGIELNPAILHALTVTFGDFTGHLDKQPGVHLVNAEARSYLNSEKQQYDLVQISLIDTWAATVAGGLALSENKLYTTDAWRDFLNTLTPNGVLAVSRWYTAEKYTGEYYRMLAIASSVLQKDFKVENPRQHLLAAAAEQGVATVLVSKSPITPVEVARYKQQMKAKGFTVLLTPDYADSKTAELLANGKADAAFYRDFPLDITPPDDDRPFFFHMIPFKDAFRYALSSDEVNNVNAVNTSASRVIFFLAVITLIATFFMIVRPLLRHGASKEGFYDALPYLGYFACIGFGFMFVEISQMQRLMIFLGHPVYGLGVVLSMLLLFSGIGSYTIRTEKVTFDYALKKTAVLLGVLVGLCILTPVVTEWLKNEGTAVRVLISAAIMAAVGFCMGWMFPLGFTLARKEHPNLLPWFWAANGAASVVASVTAVVISMTYGITAALWVGVVAYAGCAFFIWRIRGRAKA